MNTDAVCTSGRRGRIAIPAHGTGLIIHGSFISQTILDCVRGTAMMIATDAVVMFGANVIHAATERGFNGLAPIACPAIPASGAATGT